MHTLTSLSDLLWSAPLILLLIGLGGICLLRGRGEALRSVRRLSSGWKGSGNAGHSPFQACMTSLGAAMGTGNIAGVAAAITVGGAGAVFWMWIAALFGTGLIYTENVLSARFRCGKESGAAAYIRHGLGMPKLAAAFCICAVLASFGMGCMVQTHTMSQTLEAAFQVPDWLTGGLAAVFTAAVILGGAKRIGQFAQVAVPVVSGIYLLLGIFVICRNAAALPDAFRSIFRGAFGFHAVSGGITGEILRRAVTVGVRRGVFSNEAGLGSSGMLHSASDGEPEFLGACAILELVLDTFVCCTVTALAILTSGAHGADGGALVLEAFRTGAGVWADLLLPPVTALFALCTLIGWSFCGAQSLRSLTDGKFLTVYRVLFCIAAFSGASLEASLVWTLSDIANALMAWINCFAITALLVRSS